MAYVRTRLGRLFYDERGQARAGEPAIVLLHGLLFDGGMWDDQVAPLAALGRVVVIDGPGHGKSEPPPRFTLEEHADAMLDVFADLGIERAILVGLSWGGMLAMRVALQHPKKVAGLALLDTSADRQTLAERVRYRAFVALHRRVGLPYGLYEKQVAPLMFASGTLRSRPELAERAYQRAMGFDREGVARASLAVVVHRSSVLDRLGSIAVPTLVMCGDEDGATPPEKSRAIARAIPNARLVVLEGAGHMSTLEVPEDVNGHLVPFVKGILAGAQPAASARP
ncbi:MAG: alpha/beta fold hydrolase [Deltaproteobacteria bacterium]|nr:alpha/beta fold hydrolase [Deltaproteobacteria bacterium]